MTVRTIQPQGRAATETAPALRARSLGKVIDDKRILDDISFDIARGRYVALLGANGAGKSTLLKVLATLTPATSGELALFGEPLKRESAGIRSRLGMIGHNVMMYRDLSAQENLVFYGRLYGLPDPEDRAAELLGEVGLTERGCDPVKTFSRGMAQRASIARALMHDPDLLLADEPFAGLDVPSRRMLEELLARLHGSGKTILLASHDLERSLGLAEQAIVLRKGKLVLDEPTAWLDPETVLAKVTGA
ncbi:MAG: ABC transporter ATP-binding protein [Planctomycetota bacterium]